MSKGQFSVHQLFADDTTETVLTGVDPETAVLTAWKLVRSVGGRIGNTVRITITDGGDCTNFIWEYGKGVIFPTEAECDAMRTR